MLRTSRSCGNHAGGFSLVEIMVGLVIGLLASIVILQMYSLSEQRKRTTTGMSDAQSGGVMMYYQMQRDIAQAGYGISSRGIFNCNLSWQVGGTDIATPVRLAPVTINSANIPAGDANTDTVLVVYGNANSQPQGAVVNAMPSTTEYSVQMPVEFRQGDRVIAAPESCAATLLLNTVSNNPTAAETVQVATAASGTSLYNLGASPAVLAYAIRKGNLTQCDYLAQDCGDATKKDDPAVWVPVASNMVSLRAQYGRDTDGTPDAIPNLYDQSTPADACGWTRIPAVRLALVARSSQYDPEEVTTIAPAWAASVADSPAGSAAAPVILTGNANWKHYRYRVFEGIIPVRNVTWLGEQIC